MRSLKRELHVPGATLLGLGSILGTGVFVSIGIAAGVAGPSVVLSIALAAVVATFNALSSAQLAANHPVSGGTYEYGYQYLRPWLGFSAGWMFLCAKAASAATAALGFAGYALNAAGLGEQWPVRPVALAGIALLTIIAAFGIRRSNQTNTVIVSITIIALLTFVFAGLPRLSGAGWENFQPFFPGRNGGSTAGPFLEATALMFVAYTGYGRIATLGEEVHDPHRTIPKAIIITLVVSALLYIAVGAVAIGTAGADRLAGTTLRDLAPLVVVSRDFGAPWIPLIVGLGAITAMLGVLLNLILGLSRVLLAMARRGDAPGIFARLNKAETTPYLAVIAVGLVIGLIAALGSVKAAWSFSAFTVLVYYGITNLAAIRLPREQRLYPAFIPWAGLISCFGLAFWVEARIWLIGLAVLAIGLVWHTTTRRRTGLEYNASD